MIDADKRNTRECDELRIVINHLLAHITRLGTAIIL